MDGYWLTLSLVDNNYCINYSRARNVHTFANIDLKTIYSDIKINDKDEIDHIVMINFSTQEMVFVSVIRFILILRVI